MAYMSSDAITEALAELEGQNVILKAFGPVSEGFKLRYQQKGVLIKTPKAYGCDTEYCLAYRPEIIRGPNDFGVQLLDVHPKDVYIIKKGTGLVTILVRWPLCQTAVASLFNHNGEQRADVELEALLCKYGF